MGRRKKEDIDPKLHVPEPASPKPGDGPLPDQPVVPKPFAIPEGYVLVPKNLMKMIKAEIAHINNPKLKKLTERISA